MALYKSQMRGHVIKGFNGIANSVNSIRHLIIEANTLNANTMNYAEEQSDLGSYCLHYRLPKCLSR